MKRLHVNLAVTDLSASIAFYSTLFDSEPTVLKDDYAKWMLDDPRVNFAISTHGTNKGVDHLGIQVEAADELGAIHDRMKRADARLVAQGETVCCYAKSAKNWIFDPEGVAWETFHTTGESAVYGSDLDLAESESACCADAPEAGAAKAGSCGAQAAAGAAGSQSGACC
ncbi:ArsI/CadI family heavy metal resistance metalloenzyme [Oceanibacterium hippocampi]|uniref:Cadmium-induced protein CadI n=1 Tax=Oceanibacterium hippocampi TaxID=745714 RepID=A0A1Y5T547_9PROT|nr:ArsI/CadI family heavy metal resistance metalloenzyme [Oceanibacterium hippocampi]SLN56088.1 Cadmium-induced protein CadI [Oceanibacterium hippocampi]